MGCCTIFTLLMTLAPAACAIAFAVLGGTSSCGSPFSLQTWLYVAAALQIINLATVIYVFCKFDVPYNPTDPANRDFITRMNHLLCYDPVVAIYIIVIGFQVAWQIVGHIIRSRSDPALCPDNTMTMANAALTLIWVFLCLGTVGILFGYITEFCETRCCPYCANTACGMCICCLCPALGNALRNPSNRRDGPQSVTTTGGAPSITVSVMGGGPPMTGLPLTPIVPVYTSGPRAGASMAAAAYAVGALPPHQRGAAIGTVTLAAPPPGGAHYAMGPSADVPMAHVVSMPPPGVGMPSGPGVAYASVVPGGAMPSALPPGRPIPVVTAPGGGMVTVARGPITGAAKV